LAIATQNRPPGRNHHGSTGGRIGARSNTGRIGGLGIGGLGIGGLGIGGLGIGGLGIGARFANRVIRFAAHAAGGPGQD